ncbi:MAG TPA: DUF3592 domain-containing protein [Burkholderiales bacterium]|nr:DUF3592 domain-containing protein [Burkholderiales bacterium]
MKPRLGSILWTDWPALLCLMCLPVIWLVSAQLVLFRHDGSFTAREALMIALPLSLVAGGLLVWRVVRIRRLFSRGELVRAQITRLHVAMDRGRVEFAYDFRGHRVTSWTPVHKNKQVEALAVNQEVEVLVDAANPLNAIVRDLYV